MKPFSLLLQFYILWGVYMISTMEIWDLHIFHNLDSDLCQVNKVAK